MVDKTKFPKASEMWQNGATPAEIAAVIGVQPRAVYGFMTRNRDVFPARPSIFTPREKIERAGELWRGGMSAANIADVLGVKPGLISNWAVDNRDLFPSRKNIRAGGNGRNSTHIKAALEDKARIKPGFPEKAPGFDGVPTGRLLSCQCHFPLWGHHENFDVDESLYCGAPKLEGGGAYCGFHAKNSRGQGTASERAAIRNATHLSRREAKSVRRDRVTVRDGAETL